MAKYLKSQADDLILEPSAGTGALIAALIKRGHSPDKIVAVERHIPMSAALGCFNVTVINDCFLGYSKHAEVTFPRIIMNPPFRAVRAHMKAAISLLGKSATLVALVPITFECPQAEVLETLDEHTFSTAKVRTKIIRIEKL